MQVIHQLWKGRRVRVAGVLDQVAVDCPDDLAGIYQKYWELVYRRCYATLKDHEAALDATQDVFVQALHSFEDIQKDVVRGLVDLARTISYERKRRPSREVMLAEPPPNGHSHDDPAEIAESHRMLASVWSGLSDVERRYLADKFAGFSFEEIARRNRRALGTVSSNLARAREHARRMREPMVPGVLALAAWRRLTDMGRRARSVASDTSLAAAAQPVGTFTVSLTVAGILAGAVPATSAALASAPRPQMTLATASLPGEDPGAAMAGSLVGQQVHVNAQSVQTGESAPGSVAPHRNLLPTGSPASETPEDTTIRSATPSPNYTRDHTIVAMGFGNRCGCQTLLMSTDGGAQWIAAPAPPSGDEIVLPPAFPRDPAIFVGYTTGAGTLMSDWWAPRFGADFSPVHGAPAGYIALPAGFDSGDHRVIVSTPTGVWSDNLDSDKSAQPMLVDTADAPPSLSALSGPGNAAVLALTSARAVAAGGSPLAGGSGLRGQVLWACPPAQPCTQVQTFDFTGAAQLLASPNFGIDRTLIAYAGTQLAVSQDGGRGFAPLAAPWSDAVAYDVALSASPTGIAVWGVFARGSRSVLMAKPSLSAAWVEADGGNPAITSSPGGRLVVIAPQRLLFLPAQGGLLCSVNGGVTWEARCPSA